MHSTSLSPRSDRIPVALVCAVLAVGAGCLRGADVSKIVCNDTKYCPSGYVCVVPPGKTQGSCARPWDAGGSAEAKASFDGAVGIDGPHASDSVSLDGNGGGADQAADQALADVAGSPMDVSIGVDLPLADVPAESAMPLLDSSVSDTPVDIPMVADAPADIPRIDSPLKAGGAACQSGGECSSTYCVDGVCCDGACAGQCQACAEPNKVGTCSTVSGAPRGNRTACAATQATCAGACAGSLPSQCSYPAGETTCTGATCSSDLALKTASVCNGAGACTTSSVVSCDSGKYCTGGACVTQIATGSSCQNDNQCASGNCSNSLCCATGQTACSGSCVSLSTSNANCGTCGRACATGSSCTGGSCYLVDGQSCTTGAQCLGGVCGTFYYDGDHDGFGTSTSTQRCGNTPPTGYASQSGDCCDSDNTAYPGSPTTLPTADQCNSFDYNCDGFETPKSNGPTNCGTPNCVVRSGVCTYVDGCTCNDSCQTWTTVACGQTYTSSNAICGDNGSGCQPLGNGGPAGTQACN